jgi:hypothetical protein
VSFKQRLASIGQYSAKPPDPAKPGDAITNLKASHVSAEICNFARDFHAKGEGEGWVSPDTFRESSASLQNSERRPPCE